MSTETAQAPRALLYFMIGGVQTVIESARTVRDLWTGSYLMSWLTAAAMTPIVESCGYDAFITPHIDDTNPMLNAIRGRPLGKYQDRGTLPSLPNKFSAEVPLDLAEKLRDACLEACRTEWLQISNHVHDRLQSVFGGEKDWDRYWDAQVKWFLDLRCVFLALTATDDPKAWVRQWDEVGALMGMMRSVRHVPDYQPHSTDGRYPGKCSQLGTLEQMGPAEFDRSRDFWNSAATQWSGLHGTRLRTSDRLCAISLVKRFAWPAYFANTNERKGKLDIQVGDLRYSDTATLAAALWLPDPREIPTDPDEQNEDAGALDWRTLRRWSGQWLHWRTRDQDKDEKRCPGRVWEAIQARKRTNGQPPIYYAILLMDGDRMGEMFKGNTGPKEWGEGRERYQQITRRLTTFSLGMVRDIVERYGGELIYAGGDDVLASLPTETVVACGRELSDAYRHSGCLSNESSISGGIAVVHYKEDLRFALQQVRAAEKAAKQIYKTPARGGSEGTMPPGANENTKDALALCVCRRSGEHTTAGLGWGQAQLLTELVADFRDTPTRKGASDRWAYKLRAELPTLQALPWQAGRAEALRLVGRLEAAPPGFDKRIGALFDEYRAEMTKPARNWKDEDILEGFVTLCQSASFLARGRE